MKQKARFKNYGNISYRYWPMNSRYISISPQKAVSVDLYSSLNLLSVTSFIKNVSRKAWAVQVLHLQNF